MKLLRLFNLCISLVALSCKGQSTYKLDNDGQGRYKGAEIDYMSESLRLMMDQSSKFSLQITELVNLTKNMNIEITSLKNQLRDADEERKRLEIEIQGLKASNCSALSSPYNGSVFSTYNENGGIAAYSCNDGFNLQGNELRICEKSGVWSGSEPVCKASNCSALPCPHNGSECMEKPKDGVPSSYQVLGKTVTCNPVNVTLSNSPSKIMTCSEIRVDGNMRFPNHHTCTEAWKSWSSLPAGTRNLLDLPGLCTIMIKQISSTATYQDSQVYWKCDVSQTRVKFVNNQWGTVKDNGFVEHIKCTFIP